MTPKEKALEAAETLAKGLRALRLEAVVRDVPKNEWMVKVAMLPGNICVYSNAKGVISFKTHEIAPDARPKIEAAMEQVQTAPIEAEKQNSPLPVLEGHLLAFTDGSDQDRQCGWSAVIYDTEKNPIKEIVGNLGTQPNKQIAGEVEGAIQAIAAAIECKAKGLVIGHDYQGLGHWARREWKANDPDARRLQQWAAHAIRTGLVLKFTWTRAHNGHFGNERADVLAGQATRLPATPRIANPDGTIPENPAKTVQKTLSGMEM